MHTKIKQKIQKEIDDLQDQAMMLEFDDFLFSNKNGNLGQYEKLQARIWELRALLRKGANDHD